MKPENISTEHWKKIEGFDNYLISDFGRIYNVKRKTIKKSFPNKNGYMSVNLYKNGKYKTKRIHQLVLKTFTKQPKDLLEVNHIDGNKLNNNISNLEWVTHSENMIHSFKNGLSKPSYGMKGHKNPNAGRHGKRIRIIETGEIFESILECEKHIDGNNRHISDCLHGRQKTHKGYHFEYM